MAMSSYQIRATISFTINMRANNNATKLEAIVPAIPKTEGYQGRIFGSKHRTSIVTLQPKPTPIKPSSIFQSKNKACKLYLENQDRTCHTPFFDRFVFFLLGI